jgi:hypothetical protein
MKLATSKLAISKSGELTVFVEQFRIAQRVE